jgi:hypothetical protein
MPGGEPTSVGITCFPQAQWPLVDEAQRLATIGREFSAGAILDIFMQVCPAAHATGGTGSRSAGQCRPVAARWIDCVCRCRSLPAADWLWLAVQVCSAVQAMHSSTPPLAHRDVKPHNVLLAPAEAGGSARRSGAGSAKAAPLQQRGDAPLAGRYLDRIDVQQGGIMQAGGRGSLS